MEKKFIDYVKNRYKELITEGVDPEKAYTQAAGEWLAHNFKEGSNDEK